jgi:hypothetical protein
MINHINIINFYKKNEKMKERERKNNNV